MKLLLRTIVFPKPGISQAQAEHHEILDVIRSRDVNKLEAMIRKHNQGGLESYTSYLDKQTS